MDLTTAAAGVSAAFIIIATHGKVRKRRWWQRKFLKNGISYGDNLMSELLLNDGSSFRNFVRLTKSDFEELLRLVAPKISKKNTNYRAAIPPSIRLAVTLRYLATGDSFTSLMYLFKISKQSISTIVPEVCEAIFEVLKGYCQVSR
ncbi:unnamed protein product [Macrosiphum euphorbiae]|uniref:Protein ANTAGONIST OF LIKE HETEROCHROMATIN PROTEIN 1-like n=1 Tax=Macrosiphum euphorbiae TaxID=13131 RepID=A0AAV0WHJ1_9HEMI|nr:unnamed protein product [Macrosiphum euphorbiae]